MGFVLGLTGGIATGKSTVVDIFRSFGFPIVDGDQIAREIVEVGQPALTAIKREFGSSVILSDGQLNRKQLGEIIFNQPEKRHVLNQLLDPFLRKTILDRIEAYKTKEKLVIVDLPLLFEGNYIDTVDEIATVYVPESIQLKRLMARDSLSEQDAKKRISSQWPIEEKKAKSTIVFDNQQSITETKEQVVEWLKAHRYI
ncbi:dephospho-CoA kinase [Enterococcus alcedinis]|uniref:Dephospho-CoA kinase n=1 Tax=Enterococcus alcedinis TaxID=1274384 RepID=A0A917JIM1_9ENTE|nr:dephospho-CoA kinase [Enterococcus alcedinis]MBP2102407.1 dephospho-CoA kinase [Enterococcus alcedinis]GGI66059.1 dephospho-CoA kinase [Enterococcus alcedinis]